ncbi:retrovirus-related pol polyprotein from transposon TNT 1-94 [Tanacetum coccineum]
MVTTIEEAKDLATFPLDDIIGNLKVYEMILENDGVVSKTTKEKVKSLAFIAKVTKEQTSDDSDSQGGSDEYVEINSATRLIDLEEAVVMVLGAKELKAQDKVYFKCDLLPDDWIVYSGCTKHMTENRRLFTSYKAYDGRHVVFRSNLNGKVIGRGLFTSESNEIVERTHCKLRKTSRVMLDEQSIPQKFWCHALDTGTLHLITFEPNSYRGVFLGYSQTSKAYIVLNKETMRIEEFLNVTFDERLPEPNSSSLVEDDRIDEPIVQDLKGSSSLQVNVSSEGYPKSVKEVKGHPIKQVIGELNERTLRSKTKQAYEFHMTFPKVKYA